MKTKLLNLFIAMLCTSLPLQSASAATAHSNLKISHTPVDWGIKGQPLTLKARVTGGVGGIETITLYYALFRDAAPFRVNMTSSGIGLYVGTIESGLLTGVDSLSYYIEAQDKEGTIEETPWYDVTFKEADSSQPLPVVAPTGTRSASADDESSAATIGIIAGGAAAIAVGAYVLSDSGGSSGSSSGGGDDPGDAEGTYSGSATTCMTIPPAATTCSNAPITIIIDQNGVVFSDSLVPGKQLIGELSGNSFSLQANVSSGDTNFTGNIIFGGNVVGDSTIVGSISGSINDNGSSGFYSGDFNAAK